MSGIPGLVRGFTAIRLVSFALLLIFSIVVIAANAHYIYTIMNTGLIVDGVPIWPVSGPDTDSVVGLAVGILSFITIFPMFFIDFCRRTAWTSMIVTEVSWLGSLWVLWIASAAYTTSVFVGPVANLCIETPNVQNLQAACTDLKVNIAFSWLTWGLMITYSSTLLYLALQAGNRGKDVWRGAVRGNDFGYGRKADVRPFNIGLQMPDGEQPEKAGPMPTISTGYGYGEV